MLDEMHKQAMLGSIPSRYQLREATKVMICFCLLCGGRLAVHAVYAFVAIDAIGGEDIGLLLYDFVQALRFWLVA